MTCNRVSCTIFSFLLCEQGTFLCSSYILNKILFALVQVHNLLLPFGRGYVSFVSLTSFPTSKKYIFIYYLPFRQCEIPYILASVRFVVVHLKVNNRKAYNNIGIQKKFIHCSIDKIKISVNLSDISHLKSVEEPKHVCLQT